MSATTSAPLRARVRLRRSPRWLLAGVLAVCLGGLATAFLVSSVAASESVLRLNRTVYRGEVIAPVDLGVVTIGRGAEVPVVAGERLNAVVGQSALTDLPDGSLLVEGSYGAPDLPPGSARVGLRLAPGRLPSSALPPGTPVLVVALPGANAMPGSAEQVPPSVSGTLATAPVAQSDGSFVVDVTVVADRAESVARLSATERVALVRQGTAP